MANKESRTHSTADAWQNFRPSSDGSAADIRKTVAAIQTRVSEEVKIFSSASLINGGTRLEKK